VAHCVLEAELGDIPAVFSRALDPVQHRSHLWAFGGRPTGVCIRFDLLAEFVTSE
jgi:hypothetical protein